ncbi:MAG: hypothetical protein ACRDRL_18845, partial [Sciscionella sp.]
ISNTIVKRRRSLNEILTDAPAALNNLALTYDKNTGTLDTRDNIGELATQLKADPKGTLCALLDLQGLTKGGIKCHLKNGNLRAAPFGEGTRHRQNFDPSLAGLAGGRR